MYYTMVACSAVSSSFLLIALVQLGDCVCEKSGRYLNRFQCVCVDLKCTTDRTNNQRI